MGFNPYFTGLPILIKSIFIGTQIRWCFNPYFTGLPILISMNISALNNKTVSFNPYFTGLPILINQIFIVNTQIK